MKNKIVILSAFIMLLPCTLHAQWGVKIGTGLSSIDDTGAKPIISAQIGGNYDIQLSRKWFLTPEIQLVYFGGDLKGDGLSLKDIQYRFLAFELPVNISFRPVLSRTTNLLVEGGIYFRYSFWGKRTPHYYDVALENDNQSPFNRYDRFDPGLQLGIGIQKGRCYGLLSIQSDIAIGDALTNHYYRRSIRLSAGYRF
jgi:hypothetical protein